MTELIIFDLDDTLYPEIDYVKSGFHAVACYFSSQFALEEKKIYSEMMKILQTDGRGKIFDKIVQQYNNESTNHLDIIFKAVYIYRRHVPHQLKLFPDSEYLLNKIKSNFKLAILTDGVPIVQQNKIKVLNISEYFDFVLITDMLGSNFRKPSFIPFFHVLEEMKIEPRKGCYIGDDLSKDFYGASKIGLKTIWINRERGQSLFKSDFKDLSLNQRIFDLEIKSMEELIDHIH